MCPFTGDLLEEIASSTANLRLPHKLATALMLCDRPYMLSPASWQEIAAEAPTSLLPRRLALRMCKICATNFLLARVYCGFRRPFFDSAAQALGFFYSVIPRPLQRHLCLPRALFVAKTSRAFATSGVVFLGTFLPSRLMHAWVIEAGSQPDPRDNIWTQYRPVAALV